jgi:hypothetical protein
MNHSQLALAVDAISSDRLDTFIRVMTHPSKMDELAMQICVLDSYKTMPVNAVETMKCVTGLWCAQVMTAETFHVPRMMLSKSLVGPSKIFRL